jgi:hypothetical protein
VKCRRGGRRKPRGIERNSHTRFCKKTGRVAAFVECVISYLSWQPQGDGSTLLPCLFLAR